jgi:ubiquinone biosynthesis protein COQ9
MTARKKSTHAKKQPDDRDLRHALIEAALNHAPFDGFSEKTLAHAASDVGAEMTVVARLFPEGAVSLVEAYSEAADREMESALGKIELESMKVRERIAVAVKARLAALRPHKEAARRAAAFLSLPPNLLLASRLIFRTVDAMWRAAGDRSTDFNFYTKRAILAGVWSSTLMRWFSDHSDGDADTERFLAARIENVMQFEKVKAQVKDRFAKIPSPFSAFGELRR